MKYANAYLVGVGVGLVLLATFVLTGHGLGASAAYSSLVGSVVAAAAPHAAAANPSYATYTSLNDWFVYEILGVALGGAISAALAGRLHFSIERGPRTGRVTRLATAVAGGVAMGIGAKFARGCTSGLALSGGAVLSIGAWAFIVCAFAAGYAIVPAWRRLWT